MKRLIFAISLAFLVGLLGISGLSTPKTAYGFDNSSDQAQLMAPGSYRTVDWHRYRYERDYDGPYYHEYDYRYDPYYDYPYPHTYYYEPGFSVDVPFFHFHTR